jgi:DNA-binding MarR family transcriptional regulator
MARIEEVILFQIEKTNKMAKMYSQREFDRLQLNITVDQWILLKIIQEKSPISQKELADSSLRDQASITRTLDLLEKRNYISREAIEGNRRKYNLVLTTAGLQFVQTNMPFIEKYRQKSLEGFSEAEVKQLTSFLIRIQQNMH